MRALHLPVWIGSVRRSRAAPFAVLFAIFTFLRALLVTVLPLNALALLGDASSVSLLYFGASLIGIATTFSIPWLVHRFRRRWVFTAGCACSLSAALLLAEGTVPFFIVGLFLHMAAVAMIEVTSNLYVLDHIPRDQLGRFEPLRMFSMAGPWAFAPWLGVYLRTSVVEWAPFVTVCVTAIFLAGYFWYLRLTDDPAVAAAKGPAPSIFRNIRRYSVQPRLVLAWALAFGRSSWWVMFFVYGPLIAVGAGLGEDTAGLIASLGSAMLFMVPLWGWVARRIGLKRLLAIGYSASAVATVAMVFLFDLPDWVAVTLVVAAFSTGIIDTAGNLPFLRAVRSWERPAMTSVFSTYRDLSQLVPPGIFFMVLKVLPLPAIFVLSGTSMLVLSYYCRYLPRRL